MANAWHRSEYLLDGGDTPLLSMLKKYHSDNVSARQFIDTRPLCIFSSVTRRSSHSCSVDFCPPPACIENPNPPIRIYIVYRHWRRMTCAFFRDKETLFTVHRWTRIYSIWILARVWFMWSRSMYLWDESEIEKNGRKMGFFCFTLCACRTCFFAWHFN